MAYLPRNHSRRLSVTAALLLLVNSIAHAQTVDNTDVYNLASQVAEEIEFIREIMGRPFDDSPRLPVGDVSQLEVYFQAQTLFRKVNQLAQEYAAAPRAAAPAVSDVAVQASNTYEVLIGALDQVRRVKTAFGIDTEAQIQERATASTTG